MTVLLREAIGERLRRTRTSQQRTLREVSREARVSLGYLSEVERGRKEASSELLASICEALELPLAELLHRVAGDVGPELPRVPDTVPDELTEAAPHATGASEGGRLVVAGEALSDLRLAPISGAPSGGPRAMAGVAA